MSPGNATQKDSGMLTAMDSAARIPGAPSSAGLHSLEDEPRVDDLPGSACEASLCSVQGTETQAPSGDPILPDAQRRWAARSVTERLRPIRKARHWIAAHPEAFAEAISPRLARSKADTLVAELLPLLEAMRFLERNAVSLLAPRRLGGKDRPLWLAGVQAEVHHDPLGHVLVIGPSNFPLFLPGVQALQALVAGNAVTWKPGEGGAAVTRLLTQVLREAGLPRGILHVTDESVEAAQHALGGHPDKVVFTGSFETGRKVLRTLADTAIPAVLELSGADAVVVLPSADLHLTVKAVAFGLRLNGAEVCMSPRRLIATRETLQALRPMLTAELARIPAVHLKPQTAKSLDQLVNQSLEQGADQLQYPLPHGSTVISGPSPARPILLDHATPATAITRTDIFAPVLSLIEAPSVLEIPDMVNDNPYALTAAVFGDAHEAQAVASQLRVGTVVINDLIAPTADPRIPFGGRRHSGFGLTRGAEGLLEMTATRTILLRRKGTSRHYDPISDGAVPLFASLIGALHAGSWGQRLQSLKRLATAARNRNPPGS